MKLFGTRKGDEKQPGPTTEAPVEEEAGYFDSPVENVSLSAKRAAPPPAPSATRASAPPPPFVTEEEEARPHYGIENAIQLMRALPVEQNTELVVQVIKTTLESLQVRVSDIIADASRKQQDLEERVANLKRAIADFEREIETRKEEITRLEADHAETSSVKARLELAEKLQKASAAPPPMSSAPPPSPPLPSPPPSVVTSTALPTVPATPSARAASASILGGGVGGKSS